MKPLLALLMSQSVTPLREPLEEKSFLLQLLVVTLVCWALVRWRKWFAVIGLLLAGYSSYKVFATVLAAWSDGCPWLHAAFDFLYVALALLTVVLPFVVISFEIRRPGRRSIKCSEMPNKCTT